MIALLLRRLPTRWIWLALAFIPLTQTAEGSPIFGPQEFVRESGKPRDITVTFGRRLITSDYKLVVINGAADASRRVSSARVWLNGSEVLRPDDFNQNVSEVTRSVDLLTENRLTVRLAGAPGGVLKISIAATLGPNGGEIATEGGASLILPAGALAGEANVDLRELTADELGVPLPPGYTFLAAVSLDLGGAQLTDEADLEVPAVVPFVGRAIVTKVLQLGGTGRLTLVDTAARDGGFLRTNSPPFPGVRASGDYVFMSMPAGLGIAGSMVKSAGGEPVAGASVNVLMTSAGPGADREAIDRSLASLSAFVGQSDSSGFAAVPGVLPNSDVMHVAIGRGLDGLERVGVEQVSIPSLPDIVNNTLAGAWLRDVLIRELFEVDPSSLPSRPPQCPCTTLQVNPHKIPLDPGEVFSPPETRQLEVACSSKNVTNSSPFPRPAQLLLTGGSIHTTLYDSDAAVATVSPSGLVKAVAPGVTKVGIINSMFIPFSVTEPVTGLRFTSLHPCRASGVVDPVTVGPATDNARLDVQLAGSGFGSVTFDPGGASCGGGTCTEYPRGTTVQLTAVPDAGSIFTGWSGDCAGSAMSISVNVDRNLACTASFDIGGEVLAPSDSPHYESVIYTVPPNVSGATVTATVTWASDWYPPPPNERTSSFANLVEVPYRGGFGCDFIRNYPQNNFVEFESGLNPNDRNAVKVGSITVGPGKSVAIAGSDCFFGDNFRFHRLVRWTVQLH